MVQIAITLGPNCKQLKHNRAIVKQRETCGAEVQFWEYFPCKIHAKGYGENFCYQNEHQLRFPLSKL